MRRCQVTVAHARQLTVRTAPEADINLESLLNPFAACVGFAEPFEVLSCQGGPSPALVARKIVSNEAGQNNREV